MRDGTYRFGDVVVEGAAREIWRAGTRVAIEPKALDVLLVLLREAGRVVEKRRLLGEVWADVHVTDSSLARAITQVRRATIALGPAARAIIVSSAAMRSSLTHSRPRPGMRLRVSGRWR